MQFDHYFRAAGNSLERAVEQQLMVPVKSGAELGRQALQRYQERSGLRDRAVNIERLAEEIGSLQVHYLDLDGSGYLVDLGSGSGAILVRTKDRESGRDRFTAAHELGHWVAARLASVDGGDRRCRRATEKDLEKWCDQFAVEVLLPREGLRKFVEGDCRGALATALSRGATEFRVSRESFENAVASLRHVVIAIMARASPSLSYHVVRVRPTYLERQQGPGLAAFLENCSRASWGTQLREDLLLTSGLGPLTLDISGEKRKVYFVAAGV